MNRRHVRDEREFTARRCAPALVVLLGLLLWAPASQAQLVTLGPVTIGAGLQTVFDHIDTTGGGGTNDQFALDHARIYVNGSATENIKFMFNTDYDSGSNKIEVLDAVAQFDFGSAFHIWAGRFLEPSDRANLYGPFYSHEWLTYTDGVQDGYPFIYQGRNNGVMYWGDFFKQRMKVSVGASTASLQPETDRCWALPASSSISGTKKTATT